MNLLGVEAVEAVGAAEKQFAIGIFETGQPVELVALQAIFFIVIP